MTLKVNVTFEPNRLADDCLTGAYELALPVVSQQVATKKSERLAGEKSAQLLLAVKNG